jgi:hypothetical protein
VCTGYVFLSACVIYIEWWWSFLYKIFARSFKSNCGETIRSTFQGCLVSSVHPMQNTNTHVLFVRVPNQQSTLHFVSCPVDGWELFMQHQRAMAWCGMLSLLLWSGGGGGDERQRETQHKPSTPLDEDFQFRFLGLTDA